jgi:hypothetical protein
VLSGMRNLTQVMHRASLKTPFRVTWDSVALIAMYLGGMAALSIVG